VTIQQDILDEAKTKMAKAIEHLQDEFSRVRTGRASAAFVEKLRVDAYGSEMPLQQIAGFGVPEPRLLVITPYDKGTIGAIEKAIRQSDLGINPSNDGVVIRLAFPPLTEERRKEFVKVVKSRAEDARVTVRNLRRQARHDLEAFEKEGEISQDDLGRAEKDLEKLTHDHVEQIDQRLAHKEQELLEV
jgi:ribosome recycling factor